MEVILDLNGWRKKQTFTGSVLSGRVEIGLFPPMDILVRKDGAAPVEGTMEGTAVSFWYSGKHEGPFPIFEYCP